MCQISLRYEHRSTRGLPLSSVSLAPGVASPLKMAIPGTMYKIRLGTDRNPIFLDCTADKFGAISREMPPLQGLGFTKLVQGTHWSMQQVLNSYHYLCEEKLSTSDGFYGK